MLLGARLLDNVTDVNHFEAKLSLEAWQGDQVTAYLQLLDSSQDRQASPPGRRYVPAASAMLTVAVQNLDDAKKLIKAASQPFPATDPSIWSFTIYSTDVSVRGTVDLVLTLQEGTVVRNARLPAALRFRPIIPIELAPTVSSNIFPSF